MVRKILVTGGAGFIGSHLVDKLMIEGFFVRVIDNFSTGRFENLSHYIHDKHPRLEIIRGDLKNSGDVQEAVKGIDVVFHFAANPEVRVSTTNPKIHFDENVLSTFNLLEAMREHEVREIVFASSSSVYGEPNSIPVDENSHIAPVSVYGATKAACENLIHAYSRLYGIKAVILRYANVIGPRLRHGVIYDLLRKLSQNNRKLEVLGDGTQIRSYIYIYDAVEATLIAWKNSVTYYDTYNIASNDWIDVKTVVATLLDELGMRSITIEYKPILNGVGWPGDVKKIALDIRKIKELGFQPKLSSVEAVRVAVRRLAEELNLMFTNSNSSTREIEIQ
ncbi:MAG: SDR family NAD(P)-dependent oxidoreductase [Desulfurococcaceae archaeon]